TARGRLGRRPLTTPPRFASITGSPPEKAVSVDEPATGTSSASARPRAVASAIRIEVKLPGPVPTTIASIRPGSSTTSSIRSISDEARAVQPAAPPVTAATAPAEVAQSKAKIVCGFDADTAMRFVDMRESHRCAHRGEPGARVLRPLDKGNRAIEIRLEVAPFLGAETSDAVEVEVRHRNGALVAVSDRIGGAGNGLPDAERAAGAADERRLAGAELARDGDDVAGPERRREPRAEGLRLGGGCGVGHHAPRVFVRRSQTEVWHRIYWAPRSQTEVWHRISRRGPAEP